MSFNYRPNFSHEYILIFQKAGLNESDNIKDKKFNKKTFIHNYSRSIWQIETVPPSLLKQHPARFPFEIPNNLIKFYSNKGEVIFDPFAGFGTTLIEADLERR
ncbi:MAG: DNA methyltransferase [Promethearchaeia archaeon]